MTDDLLKRASAAVREETADADEGARFTRARVMASLQQSQIRRRSRLAVLLPLAACFAAASAFGMVTGRVPALVQSVSHSLGFSDAPAPKPAPARRKPTSTPVTASPTPSAVPAELAAALEPLAPVVPAPAELAAPAGEARAREPRPAPALRARERASSAVPVEPKASSSASSALSDVSDRAHELYRVAHRSHFVDHDFVSALRAWDAYLEAAPNGRFVLEARYNRALSLVRLGRTSEARDALAPFASGKFAGYRQEEARALLDALND